MKSKTTPNQENPFLRFQMALAFVGLNSKHIPINAQEPVEALVIEIPSLALRPAFQMHLVYFNDIQTLVFPEQKKDQDTLAWKLQFSLELPIKLSEQYSQEVSELLMFLNHISTLGHFHSVQKQLFFSYRLLSEQRQLFPPLVVRCVRLIVQFIDLTYPMLVQVESGKQTAKATIEKFQKRVQAST
ncbi:MAG: hypothetical protein IV090_05925 [Candidatus Sericytochromatia bacterium]|nr:hypothetical protein [Candidatus Sericytochromatia bacterium]